MMNCTCLEASPRHPDVVDERRVGCDETEGRFADVNVIRCAHVFPSIRGTVATLLENASVLENVAAGIIGHEKPTMTYGLYSGNASLAVKRKAIEKLVYPQG
jgi:hypothetical protein